MEILSLGKTLGFSHRLGIYVQCFAGLDKFNRFVRLLGLEQDMPAGTLFECDIKKDSSDDRRESFILKAPAEKIGEVEISEIMLRLDEIAYDSIEDAQDSGRSLAAVRIRSLGFSFAQQYKSVVDLCDEVGDRVVLRYLAEDVRQSSFKKLWLKKNEPAIAIIGNKKINRDWICVKLFHEDFPKPFDLNEYQRKVMQKRRAVTKI